MKLLPTVLTTLALTLCAHAAPIKVLLIDGQNNHAWATTSPEIKKILEEPGIFTVDVATSPKQGEDMNAFVPKFADYQVVVSNYNGALWSPAAQEAFEKYVSGGGGFVPVHAADNSFPEWKAYNEMIGLGGWGGRNEKSGPYLRLVDGKWTADISPATVEATVRSTRSSWSRTRPNIPSWRGFPRNGCTARTNSTIACAAPRKT